MAETLKLPSSTRFSRSADRSNIQGSAISRVEKGNRMSLRPGAAVRCDAAICLESGVNRPPRGHGWRPFLCIDPLRTCRARGWVALRRDCDQPN